MCTNIYNYAYSPSQKFKNISKSMTHYLHVYIICTPDQSNTLRIFNCNCTLMSMLKRHFGAWCMVFKLLDGAFKLQTHATRQNESLTSNKISRVSRVTVGFAVFNINVFLISIENDIILFKVGLFIYMTQYTLLLHRIGK